MREKELFRDNLERLDMAFPGKELLSKKDVAMYCGMDNHTVVNRFDFTKNYISKTKLASALSQVAYEKVYYSIYADWTCFI